MALSPQTDVGCEVQVIAAFFHPVHTLGLGLYRSDPLLFCDTDSHMRLYAMHSMCVCVM